MIIKYAARRKLKSYYDDLKPAPVSPTQIYPLQDNSLKTLEILYEAGYDKIRYIAQDTSCPICRKNNGRVYNLSYFLSSTTHSAPIFSHTHVNDRCHVQVFDSADILPAVLLDYRGIELKELYKFLENIMEQLEELAKVQNMEYPNA